MSKFLQKTVHYIQPLKMVGVEIDCASESGWYVHQIVREGNACLVIYRKDITNKDE